MPHLPNHPLRHDGKPLEPHRDRKPAVALADDAAFALQAPPGVVRELCDHAVHVAANTTDVEQDHARL